MAGTSVDGLVSGLGTSDLVNQLMQAEGAQQAQLRSRKTSALNAVTAFQNVNARMLTLQDAAKKLTADAGWQTMKASASADALSVSASATAQPASLTLHVEQLASAQSSAYGTAATAVTLSQAGADGTAREVTVTGDGTLAGLAAGINGAGLDLRATVVTTAAGEVLQVASTRTGTGGGFTVTGAGTATTLTEAQDAVVRLGGTGRTAAAPGSGGILLTSSTNTFSDAVPGVTFTAVRTQNDVAVTVARDEDALVASVRSVVDAANAALGEMGRVSAASSSAAGRGVLVGNSTIRQLQQQVMSTLGALAPALSGLGVGVTRDGKITFDAEKFRAGYRADPAATQRAFTVPGAQPAAGGFAQRLAAVAESATQAETGLLSSAIAGRQRTVKDLEARIESWDQRLALRRTTLTRQFAAMETALGRLRSQSTWLAGQIAGLPS